MSMAAKVRRSRSCGELLTRRAARARRAAATRSFAAASRVRACSGQFGWSKSAGPYSRMRASCGMGAGPLDHMAGGGRGRLRGRVGVERGEEALLEAVDRTQPERRQEGGTAGEPVVDRPARGAGGAGHGGHGDGAGAAVRVLLRGVAQAGAARAVGEAVADHGAPGVAGDLVAP